MTVSDEAVEAAAAVIDAPSEPAAREIARRALEAAAPHMRPDPAKCAILPQCLGGDRAIPETVDPDIIRVAQAEAWDRACESMVFEDGTKVRLKSNNNPYRTTNGDD